MAQLIQIIDAQAIADFYSASQLLIQDYGFAIQFTKVGSDGNPLITIECSNDGVDWFDLDALSTDVPVVAAGVMLEKKIFLQKFIRVKVEANGATTGTITAQLFLRTDN